MTEGDTLSIPGDSHESLTLAEENGWHPLREVLEERADLAQLDQMFRQVLLLLASNQVEAAGDILYILKDETSAMTAADHDSISAAYLASLDRRVSLLAGVVAEEHVLHLTVAPEDSLLSAAYANIRGLSFPDSLIPVNGDQRRAIETDLLNVENPLVEKWVTYYLGPGRNQFQRWLERMSAYDSLIYAQLDLAGLPRELIYLSAIESGFITGARSDVGAVGPWQFMPGTARHYKLRSDWWVDERQDVLLSTQAATRYLSQLYNRFGDWALVLAGYNTGEHRVERAILLSGHDDFWRLRLPVQTRNHIPKFIAAARIGSDPAPYGLKINERPDMEFETIQVTDATDLELIAKCAGRDPKQIKTLNPALLRAATPPGRTDYPVKVPVGTARLCMDKLSKIPFNERLTWRRHTVQRGETLGQIAKRFGTSVNDIATLNRIKNMRLIHPGDKLLIPMPVALAERISKRASEKGYYVPPDGYERVSYKVKNGDTLGGVARKLGVSLKHLRQVNNIHKTNLIRPGQRLYAYRPGR